MSNYRKGDYPGGNQNWDIDLDEKGNVYIANNKGLLILNRARIDLYEMPQKTILRSVACLNGKVYTGSFEDFGYWEPNEQGYLEYTSLAGLLKNVTLNNDEFWKIVAYKRKIYFQSFGTILSYDHNHITPLKIPGAVMFLLKSGGRLFIQQINGGLFEIVDDELVFIEGSHVFTDTEVKTMLSISESEFIIGTSSKGLYYYNGVLFSEWQNEASSQLKEFKINNGTMLRDRLVFGTILKGIYILNTKGKLLDHIFANNSLQNNTILSMRSDSENNLWVGLDKGFDYVAFNSPIETYTDQDMSYGTAYTACLFNNQLFIGTNQGIYYYSLDESGKFTNRQFLPETQGQVWFLQKIDGELYCGLNNGTFIIRNYKLFQVSGFSGGYNLKFVASPEEDFLLQSTYNVIVVYRKQPGYWQQSHTIKGFGAPARFLEPDHIGNLWLGHTISGIYMVQPSAGYDSATLVYKFSKPKPLSKSNRVFKVDNRIVIPTGTELLQWDAVKNEMVPFGELCKQLEGFETSITIVSVSANKYWFIKKNELGMFEVRFGKAKLLYRIIPQMYGLDLVEDYENIVCLNDSLHLICLENGFSILNLHRLNQLADINRPPLINEVLLWKNPGRQIRFVPGSPHGSQIKHSYNNLSVTFSGSGPLGQKKYFQYLLQGIDQQWSEWSSNSQITYNRLPPGAYTFLVRTLTNKGIITEPGQVTIRIRHPWHLSYLAIIFYILALFALLLFLRINYLKRRWKKRENVFLMEQEKILIEKDQAEGEIIRLRNEKLQSEIAFKNAQLATSTMAIIRKNELLNEIQVEIDGQKVEFGSRLPNKFYSRIRKLIERNIASEHDWELFEKLFDQAHENFFQRLKAKYNELTPSDLRLCAYLRLNLASKEIAPLLNISTRGVEERRYRLRKRLQLPSEQNLTEFILTF
ncbi:MAG: triple tyrosine motif-containing protein [Bacteroidales bacterium]|nr:triple tyrosine motif-containing protein [Bacteroidales bacterium]